MQPTQKCGACDKEAAAVAHRWDSQSRARTCIRPLAATPKKSSCRRQGAMGGRDAGGPKEAAAARAAAAAEGACMVAGAPPPACGISHSMLGCLTGDGKRPCGRLLGSLPLGAPAGGSQEAIVTTRKSAGVGRGAYHQEPPRVR